MKIRGNRQIARYVALVLFLWIAILSPPAHAYLDPGTGSMLFQFLVAGAVSFLFILKTYWRRIKNLFSNLLGTRNGEKD